MNRIMLPNVFSAALGIVLKQQRAQLKHSQAEVAKIVGISESLYSRIEGGRQVPRHATFVKLVEHLQLDSGIAAQLEGFRSAARGSREEDAGLPDEVQALILEIRRLAHTMPASYASALIKEIRELTD